MAHKKVCPPQRKYYVMDPVMIVQLGEWEQIVNHMLNLALLVDTTDVVAKVKLREHTQIIREARNKLKEAKEYYGIK